MRGGERGKKGKGLQFPLFRWSKVANPRIKVGLPDEATSRCQKNKRGRVFSYTGSS